MESKCTVSESFRFLRIPIPRGRNGKKNVITNSFNRVLSSGTSLTFMWALPQPPSDDNQALRTGTALTTIEHQLWMEADVFHLRESIAINTFYEFLAVQKKFSMFVCAKKYRAMPLDKLQESTKSRFS
ncbi:hypothetical protein V6N12_001388 [Hibiscus sabdariffa]|uniref:Uncharacterized protein n=1 Tax=Hibiscus sabdariffa TaxID=183260 RepID=A0ABR2AMT0_9ROSI